MPLPDLMTAFFPIAQKKRTLRPANGANLELASTGVHGDEQTVPFAAEHGEQMQMPAPAPAAASATPGFYPEPQPNQTDRIQPPAGDRYARDARGIPIQPAGTQSTDKVLRPDGSASNWTWSHMNYFRNTPLRSAERGDTVDAAGRSVMAGEYMRGVDHDGFDVMEGIRNQTQPPAGGNSEFDAFRRDYEQQSGGIPIEPEKSEFDKHYEANSSIPAFYPGADAPRPQRDSLEEAYRERENLLKSGPKRESKLWKRILGGALRGMAAGGQNGLGGGLGGALVGALSEGFSPSTNQKMRLPQNVARVDQQIAGLEQEKKLKYDQRRREAEIENIDFDNRIALGRLANQQDETRRKEGDRKSREATARMNAVAGMLKSLPSYDPNDPKFAELTKALGDVNLPITAKDAKKKIDLIQDHRTGEWTVSLVDPVTGKQEVRDVVKDGKKFISTPQVIMQGELGLLRQNDQQAFTAEQNQINRQFQAQMESARIQARAAFKQLEIAVGTQKALQQYRDRFIRDYRKRYLIDPDETAINDYLLGISGREE